MAQFDACVAYVLKHEGGLSESPSDPGLITSMGISLRFLREVPEDNLKRAGIFEPPSEKVIRELTLGQAEKLYYSEFWICAPFDKIMNPMIGKYLFDMSIQHGLHQAVKIAQRASCAAQKSRGYIKDDGLFGPKTLQAFNQASFMLIPALIAAREGFVRQLMAVNPKLEAFADGWLNRVYDI